MNISLVSRLTFISAVMLLGSACSAPSLTQTDSPSAGSEWETLQAGAERRELIMADGEHRFRLLAYRLEKDQFNASLRHGQPASLEQWAAESNAQLAFNGGYFSEENEPTGWLVIEGEEIGSRRYDPLLSGLLLIDSGRAELVDTMTEKTPEIKANTSLVQSFPVLIRQGVNAVEEDSGKLARRTVAAEDAQGRLLFILVDQTPISLFRLGRLLEESELGITYALNLDGGPSTGLWSNLSGSEEAILPLGPLPQAVIFQAHPQG